jgi:excinuclease ABC subunit A
VADSGGTPEDVASVKESYTGQYLKPVLARAPAGRLPAGESEGANKKPKRQAAE